jgi:putative ABC transport system permease protein
MMKHAVSIARACTGFTIMRDFRHAARMLTKSPTLVLVATLSLGLGVGVNTTLYSVFRTLFMQPPTAIAPERLVRIEPGNSNQISYLNFRDLLPGTTLEDLAAYAMTRLNLRSGDDVEKITGMMVSETFFGLLGVQPSVGRTFSSLEEEPAAVLSYEFWRSHFSDRSDSLDIALNLNGHPFTVIGILPKGYRPITGALGPDVYVPISEVLAPNMNKRSQAFLTMLGRLRENVPVQQAQAAVTSQTHALERIYPTDNRDLGRPSFLFPVSGLGSWRTRGTPMSSLVALTAIPFVIFGLVLLIACANVAGLLLARGAARRREIAIRLAIGATRSRVISTLLVESLLLSVLGSVAGLLFTYWLCGLVSSIPLPQAPGPLQVSPDLSILFYALFLALITTLACGLTPAIASTNPHLIAALKQDAASHGRRLVARSVLVSGQVAVSTLLLFISMLCLRSLIFISSVDPGFNLEHILTAGIDLDRDRHPSNQRLRFAAQAAEAVQALPGVLSASVTNLIPLGGDVYGTVYEVEGKTIPRRETYYMNVGPNYFRTMDIRLRVGREFTAADRPGAPAVAIVNEAFARTHSLGPNPVGAHVRSRSTDPWLEIVGVVADSKYAFFGEAPHPILFRPFLQAGGSLFVVARTSGAPAGMISALKSAILDIDKSAIVEPRTIRDATSLEFSLRRLGAWLLGATGALGLALALIGLYGVMSYTVNRRTQEIGIRMALGASRSAILWMVLRNGLGLVAIGVSIGTLISLAAARPLAFLMSGIPTSDPVTILITATLLFFAGLGASYIPSRRATRVDPIVMLRYE